MSSEKPRLLPHNDAAAYLGIGTTMLKRERERGALPFKRIGTRYYYNLAMLDNYAATLQGGTGEHPRATDEGRITQIRRDSLPAR